MNCSPVVAEASRSRFTNEQIISILKEVEAGIAAKDACRKHGISEPTIYRWKAQFGRMEASDARRLRDLEAETRRREQLVAHLSPAHPPLKAQVIKPARAAADRAAGRRPPRRQAAPQ